MNTHRRKHSAAGFTLVELIVVIVIILILAGVLVPQLLKYVDRANQAKCAQQRRELTNEFQIMGTEVAGLGECTSVAAVEALLGSNIIQYMIDNGFAQADATICPVHDEGYTLDLSYIDGRQSVTFVCPCVESVNGFLSGFQTYYPEKGYQSDLDAMKAYLEEHDSLPKVSPSITRGTQFEKEDNLYWRPHRLKEQSASILYAGKGNATKDSSNSAINASFKASLLYINGTIYESTNKNGTGIAEFSKYTLSQLTTKLENGELEFKRVE